MAVYPQLYFLVSCYWHSSISVLELNNHHTLLILFSASCDYLKCKIGLCVDNHFWLIEIKYLLSNH